MANKTSKGLNLATGRSADVEEAKLRRLYFRLIQRLQDASYKREEKWLFDHARNEGKIDALRIASDMVVEALLEE